MDNLKASLNQLMEERNWNEKYRTLISKALNDPDVLAFLEEHKDRLSNRDIIASSSNIYEFVQEKRKIENGGKSLAPGFYPKLLINKNTIDVTYVPTQDTRQKLKEEEVNNRIKLHHLPKDIANVRLDDVDLTKNRQEIVTELFKFIDAYSSNPKQLHQGVYLHGPFGVGKTFLMGALARELALLGVQTQMYHFPTFIFEVKQAIGDNTISEKVQPLRESPVLVIDDIGAESLSAWIRDDILGVILQYRMQEQLPTFFTSNKSMAELETHLATSQKGDEEPLKAKRIMERVKYLAHPIELSGQNRRHEGDY